MGFWERTGGGRFRVHRVFSARVATTVWGPGLLHVVALGRKEGLTTWSNVCRCKRPVSRREAHRIVETPVQDYRRQGWNTSSSTRPDQKVHRNTTSTGPGVLSSTACGGVRGYCWRCRGAAEDAPKSRLDVMDKCPRGLVDLSEAAERRREGGEEEEGIQERTWSGS